MGTRRVAEHVNVDGKWQLGDFASPFNHPCNAHAAERVDTLVDEYVVDLLPLARHRLA